MRELEEVQKPNLPKTYGGNSMAHKNAIEFTWSLKSNMEVGAGNSEDSR